MKRFLPLFTLTGLLFGQNGSRKDSSKGWSGSGSYGFSSEKIPFSFFDFSYLYNIDEHSGFYGTLSIISPGIGLGYKYYTVGKSKSSMFISTCAYKYFLGEFSPDVSGFSIGTGVSKYKSETNMGGFRVKSFLNIGISIYYISSKSYSRERENEFGILPFINLERRW